MVSSEFRARSFGSWRFAGRAVVKSPALACFGARAISYEICQEIQRPKRAYPPHWCLLIRIFVEQSRTKLSLDLYLSTPYGSPQPGRRIGAMFGRVDGSMTTAPRPRRTGGHAVPAPEGMPAVLATRRCRKDQPKRSGGNTGNTGNPLPQSGASDSSRYQAHRCICRRPVCAGWAWRKLAETGGNPPESRKEERSHHLLSLSSLTRASRSPPLRSAKSIRTFSSSLL
jgi:hypothetical protein